MRLQLARARLAVPVDQPPSVRSRACPCGTRGLWNRNWFSNTIRGPRLISSVCLLLHDDLSPAQQESCDGIVRRTYDFEKEIVPTYRSQTGANLINVRLPEPPSSLLPY